MLSICLRIAEIVIYILACCVNVGLLIFFADARPTATVGLAMCVCGLIFSVRGLRRAIRTHKVLQALDRSRPEEQW